ncbi:LuxR C-terminal-related transcriptional regulator [Streptomyces sp. NPDC057199]|uniref:LuxR C-terminal-related transcriptional regulator n=1 Tax=Streptomyces sp. NPDC057199 TaxID=3346047 RepID=UPI003635E35E
MGLPTSQEREAPVGRDRECGLLDGLLASLTDRGAALLLWGDTGVGKSMMLDYVARFGGAELLRARGVESEAVLPYTVLADLLLPLRRYFTEIPAAQCRALEGCLALADVVDVNPYAVCAGALGVLAAAGEVEPLVVLVDDLHWVDPSSRRVLQFVARRLITERVALVMAVRTEAGGEDGAWEGVPQITLSALDADACRELLRRRGLDPADSAVARLIRLSKGNPLVLVEYADTLTRVRTGGERRDLSWETPGPLVERAWWGRMRALPRRTRDALLYVAVSGSPEFALLERALKADGLSLGDLGAAEESGLVHTKDDSYELRHPVLRPLVLARCSVARRLHAYRVLAELSSGELRTWYLAAAAAGPDETVAAALAGEAALARRRGALGTSARTWHRAAELSPAAADKTVRLLNAAQDALYGGATGDAAQWCEQALRWNADPGMTADIELLRGQARSWLGDPLGAHRLMIAAAAGTEPVDRERACALYGAATMPAVMGGRIAWAADSAARCDRLARGPGMAAQQQMAAAMRGSVRVMAGHVRESRRLLLDVKDALCGSGPAKEQQLTSFVGMALSWADEEDAAREALDTVIDKARRDGAPALLPFALVGRCELESWSQWAAARADGAEALRWGQEFEHRAMTGYALTLLARLEGLRGDRAGCEERIASYEEHCGEAVSGLEVFAQAALGSAAMAAGDLEPCRTHLERAFATAQETGLRNPNLMPFVADLAEAHHRSGNRERTADITGWLRERADFTGLAWPAAAYARCRIMLAESADEAREWQAAAEQAHALRPMTFELARTRLVSGQALRRFRRPAAAREPLLAAQQAFAALGATPWTARAAAELAATGHRSDPRDIKSSRMDQLTAQELQVARAIGDGLSNVEAATALFLSRKTVEAHLTRVYRKLGIRSRTDLARCLARAGVIG